MTDQQISTINIKTPRKVLHFSDGILEIFDDDEEEQPQTKEVEPEVDEKELTWTPWFLYKARRLGEKVVTGLDYTGEKLADFLHITRPKYSYEIQAYMREQQQKAFDEREAKDNTWIIPPEPNNPITTPPKQSENPRF